MKLVAIPPTIFLKDSQFGEPVGDEKEISPKSGSRKCTWNFGAEASLEHDLAARFNRFRKIDYHDSAICRIAIVWSFKPQPVGQVLFSVRSQPLQREKIDVFPSPLPAIR